MTYNIWFILISVFLLYVIIKKIINLNKPFNQKIFIEKYNNSKKLEKKINLDNFKKNIPLLTSYYIGINNI